MDHNTLELLRQNHPAWRLLRADNVAFIAGFLHNVFVAKNVRVMAQTELVEALEDELYVLRAQVGDGAYPKRALDYVNDWAHVDRGWLRKFYRQGSDDPHYDLTPATEKAIGWLTSLTERSFVGTESRLLTLFELLKQMCEGSETDPEKRIEELEKRRAAIDDEIARAREGDLRLLDDTGLKDRFQQFVHLARELLSDFREVEHNFRQLDRRVRERITLWAGSKGALLEEIMGERDAITDSDQGRSFRAFWDLLMSSRRQEELSSLLERVLALPPVAELKPDPRTRRVHYDWLAAGENTQRNVARLSQQLRRFLDDKVWLENRRIMDILREVEAKALHLRAAPPRGDFMSIAEMWADVELPMERPLYTPALKPIIRDVLDEVGEFDVDITALYNQVAIDRERLARNIRQVLQERSQISLGELCELRPLQHGLAELLAYLQLASDGRAVVDEKFVEIVSWEGERATGERQWKSAHLPRVIFVR